MISLLLSALMCAIGPSQRPTVHSQSFYAIRRVAGALQFRRFGVDETKNLRQVQEFRVAVPASERLSDGDLEDPQLSSDGRWLAIRRSFTESSVIVIDVRERRTVYSDDRNELGYVYTAQWLDGNRLWLSAGRDGGSGTAYWLVAAPGWRPKVATGALASETDNPSVAAYRAGRKAHEAAAKILEASRLIPPIFAADGGSPSVMWASYLDDLCATSTSDGSLIAALACDYDYAEGNILAILRNGKITRLDLPKDARVPWLMRFWNGWLVAGMGMTEKKGLGGYSYIIFTSKRMFLYDLNKPTRRLKIDEVDLFVPITP